MKNWTDYILNPTAWEILLERIRSHLLRLCSQAVWYPWRKMIFAEYHWSTVIYPGCEFRQCCNVALGRGVVLNRGVVVHAPVEGRLVIGDKTQLNPYVVIYGRATIGKKVMIAPHVMLAGGNHVFVRTDIPMMDQGSSTKGGISIQDDVWIGANVVVLDGVTIGKGSIVAAGSVVTKSVEPYCIIAGIPGRIVGRRQCCVEEERGAAR